ncbi:MAG: hypothetical protein K9K38_09720 [Rhodoferax sp.]|nr:hypothetical protein [Rhodoferax sp.]MCF8209665.1 hypothetical protein [Rhodoferax sp.]
MHRAPAVSFSVARSSGYALALACVWCAGAVAVLMFLLTEAVSIDQSLLCIAVALACAGIGWVGWLHSATGRLQWDGQRWAWSGFAEGVQCKIQVHLDFQRLVLILVREAAGTSRQWLWLQSMDQPAQWTALRRALVAPDTPEHPVDDGGQRRAGLADL